MKKPEKHVERMLAAARRAEERRALYMARLEALMARMAEARKLADARRASRPPRGKKPPREEGGEPVPAVPRPKPRPLEGGAAAPLPKSKRRNQRGIERGARLLDIPAETGSSRPASTSPVDPNRSRSYRPPSPRDLVSLERARA